ncbi:MAG TPA: sugar phosphate isomerase/epimerase [Trebonia sp.]|nr:sugar phosphate isomerase/epimerase [Trebonia sp.]
MTLTSATTIPAAGKPPTTRRSVATVSLGDGTLEEKLTAAAAAGFDGVELCEADLQASRLSPAQAGQAAADLGLRVCLYQPFRDFEAVPAGQLRAGLDRAERAFDTMAAVGADTLLVCSSTSPQAIDDDALAASQLALLADRAGARGMRVAWEAMSWATRVSDYRHGWRIVRAAAHPALGVCLDSFHILAQQHDPAGIGRIPGEKIFFAQLAGAPLMPLDLLTWSRHHRCLPGAGDLDVTGFAAVLAAAGYTGPWSLEVFSDQLRAARPAVAAAECMRSLAGLARALRRRDGLSRAR